MGKNRKILTKITKIVLQITRTFIILKIQWKYTYFILIWQLSMRKTISKMCSLWLMAFMTRWIVHPKPQSSFVQLTIQFLRTKKPRSVNCPNSSNQNNRKRNPYKKLLRIQKLTPEKKRREKNLIKGHHKNNRLYSHK